jgi:hypothetical protein
VSETYSILRKSGVERYDDREEWMDRIIEIHEEREMGQTSEGDALEW